MALQEVHQVLDDMEGAGLQPNYHTHQYLLQLHCSTHNWSAAIQTLDTMRLKGFGPRQESWHVICRELDSAGAPYRAVRDVLKRMDENTRHRFDHMYALTSPKVTAEDEELSDSPYSSSSGLRERMQRKEEDEEEDDDEQQRQSQEAAEEPDQRLGKRKKRDRLKLFADESSEATQ